jgi:hypothetical protein
MEMIMTQQMIRKVLTAALVFELTVGLAFAQSSIGVTGAGGGVYPSDTAFGSVTLSGLQFSLGVNIRAVGTVGGNVDLTLFGLTPLGQPQNIEVEGLATAGSGTAESTATVSGTATLDMGDGTPPLIDIPFTLTVVATADGQGTLTLVVGSTHLPAATVNEGGLAIQ